MENDTTQRAEFVFKVKEHADLSPFIFLEPWGGFLQVSGNGFFSLELNKEVTPEQAEELTELLNASIKHVCYTKLND